MVKRKKKVIFFIFIAVILSASHVFANVEKVFQPPVESGRITSVFGKRHLFGRSFHYGLDIAIPVGTPIYASESGRVTRSSYNGSYGNIVEIQHEGALGEFRTRYAHNNRNIVNVGNRVMKGQIIAYSGNTGDSTGPHLHFEIRRGPTPIDPLTLTDLSNFDHTGIPAGIGNIVDFAVMGIENTVVIFFNLMEEKIMNPLKASLPIILMIDLDITQIAIVQDLHQVIKEASFKLLPFIILFYLFKMMALNLIGEKREFVNHTFFKFVKAGIFMQISLFIAGMYLGIATSIILFFINYVGSDFSKIMYSYGTISELFSASGITSVLSIINFFIYLILIVVVLIRVVDLALITVLTPLAIAFAEFVDGSLYQKFINVYIGIPIAQFTTVLCFAFALGFAETQTPTLIGLDYLGRFILSIASAVYALVHPGQVKRIFQISSIEAIDSLVIASKGLLVIDNKLFGMGGDNLNE